VRRYVAIATILGLMTIVISLQACVKVTLEQPKEKVIRVDKIKCISLPFKEANCDDALKQLNELIKANPNDLWARSERADIRHIVARENMTQAIENAKNDPRNEEEIWHNFLAAWNEVYRDIQYFYLAQANREDVPLWVQHRIKRILADFFYLNGDRLYNMATQTKGSENATQLTSDQIEQYGFLAGELYHIAVSLHAKNYLKAKTAFDKAQSFSMRVILDEICESWYACYTAYNNYRSVKLGDSIDEVILCHTIKNHQNRINLKWNVGSFLPSRYKEISDIFYMVRKRLRVKANKSNKREDWLDVVDKSTNAVTALIMSEFIRSCSSKQICDDVTSSLDNNNVFLLRVNDLRADAKKLRDVETNQNVD
jgi:hypothetical protein